MPVPYFHVVFTLPAELRRLVRSHQAALLPVLFRAAFTSLARLCAGDYGVRDECAAEISEKRLRALPFATMCLSCQRSAEDTHLRGRRRRLRADLSRGSTMDAAGI